MTHQYLGHSRRLRRSAVPGFRFRFIVRTRYCSLTVDGFAALTLPNAKYHLFQNFCRNN